MQPIDQNPISKEYVAPEISDLSPQTDSEKPKKLKFTLTSVSRLSKGLIRNIFVLIFFVFVGVVASLLFFVVKGDIDINTIIDHFKNEVVTEKEPEPTIVEKPVPQIPSEEAIKIINDLNKDTDRDSIPDFIETDIGLDPMIDDTLKCLLDSCTEESTASAAVSDVSYKHVYIVLDSSGSMSLEMEGRSKLDVAKEAVKEYYLGADENTKVGLVVFGHKGTNTNEEKDISCASSEEILSLGFDNPDQLDWKLATFQPRGWAPIGSALDLALTKLSNPKIKVPADNKFVLLITDSADECFSDPMGAASKVKKLGSSYRLDVIGLDAGEENEARLNEIAEASGGFFVNVNSSTALTNLLTNHRELIQEVQDCSLVAMDNVSECTENVYSSGFLSGRVGAINQLDTFSERLKEKYGITEEDEILGVVNEVGIRMKDRSAEYLSLIDTPDKLFNLLFGEKIRDISL